MGNADARILRTAGVALLSISLATGFVIQAMPLPRLALSAHLVGLIGSLFLIAFGVCWPLFKLTRRASTIAAACAVYGFCGGWLVYFLAAATRTGGMFPMASGNTRGFPALEAAMSVVMLTLALALFALCGIVLNGLRQEPTK